MQYTCAGLVFGLVVLAAGVVACGGGDTTTSSATGTGGASTTSSATGTGGAGGASSTTTTGSTSTSSTATSTSTGTGGPAYGYCTKACGTVTDCCPASAPANTCPSNMYPNNYHCDVGACRPPQCGSTTDCSALDPKQDCFAISGFKSCANFCAVDGDCPAQTTCSGVDDTGKKYCLSWALGVPTTPPAAGSGSALTRSASARATPTAPSRASPSALFDALSSGNEDHEAPVAPPRRRASSLSLAPDLHSCWRCF